MNLNSDKLIAYSVKNFFDSDQEANIEPLVEGVVKNSDLDEIVVICNQTAVYDLLFNEKFQGRAYTQEDALGFVNWAAKGWETGEYFVFIVRDESENIIGAIDIKSNKQVDAEVGYWMNENSPGYMTNVVIGLISVAKAAGFKSLMAYTREDNDKSQRVLIRAGFESKGKLDKGKPQLREKFVRIL